MPRTLKQQVRPVTFLDLFAGCGGLTLGFKQAGLLPTVAIEKSDMAGETYFRNFHQGELSWDEFLELPLRDQLEEGLIVGDVSRFTAPADEDEQGRQAMDRLRANGVDIVVGGPPCQGFSLAGRRRRRDDRNSLPDTFLDFVEELAPKAVVIENVLGINRAFKKEGQIRPYFEELHDALRDLGKPSGGYLVQRLQLDAQHFGVPQRRSRMMLLGLRNDVAEELGVDENNLYDGIWRSKVGFEQLKKGRNADLEVRCDRLLPEVGSRIPGAPEQKIHTAGEALIDLGPTGYLDDVSYDVQEFSYAKFMRGQVQDLENHKLRKHGPRVEDRFKLYRHLHTKRIPNSILSTGYVDKSDLPDEGTLSYEQDLATLVGEAVVRVEGELEFMYKQNATLGASSGFSAGEEETLAEAIVRLATRKHSQTLIDPKKPSPTVLTLPDDLVHWEQPRILTVRELARLQSFPDSFVFHNKETTGGARRREEVPQYSQVGNAVPPLVAQAIGELLNGLLRGTPEA